MRYSILVTVIAVLLAAGCSKRTVVPDINITKIDAEHSLAWAMAEMDEADEAGADIGGLKNMLDSAQKKLQNNRYTEAKSEADLLGEKAHMLKQDKLAGIRSREDARAAIDRASGFIDKMNKRGADTGGASASFEKARASYESGDYSQALAYADESARKASGELSYMNAGRYVVRPWEASRDCLWNIAGRKGVYNDPWKWKKIYRANSSKIDDPDIIHPGQELIIPRD